VERLPAGGIGISRLLAELLEPVQAPGRGIFALQVADLCVAVSLAGFGDAGEDRPGLCCVAVGHDGRHEDFVRHFEDLVLTLV